MKNRVISFALVAGILLSSPFEGLALDVDPKVKSNTNINLPNIDKNWFDEYLDIYEPADTLPKVAPSAIGIRSFGDSSRYEYKQSLGSLNSQSSYYYVNSFEEIFPPGTQRTYSNLMGESDDPTRETIQQNKGMGVQAFDNYKPDEYAGLTEEELKWLINNQIFSRDPANISVDLENIQIGELEPLYTPGRNDDFLKTPFLMALHKATYGVFESRPIVFSLTAYRKSEKITWTEILDEFGALKAYRMKVGEFKDQKVDSKGLSITKSGNTLDRHEYKVRLENDTHFSVVTYPEHDKIFVTSPNVFELYLKSYLDKGIINSKNLADGAKEFSKNSIINGSAFRDMIVSYGKIDSSKNQSYPAWAYELGPYEPETGVSHVYFTPTVVGDNSQYWGKSYTISGKTITYNPDNVKFFDTENMITMEALKFIEVILRQTEGDMTDTEAQIVSYKYGANMIDSLVGSDRSTVMYLTAKGILNFENFDEYRFLYEPFNTEFGLQLLYRVANPAARMNFSTIQLTDSDNFWIGKGFGSYNMGLKTPDKSVLQSYLDQEGDLTINPQKTSGLSSTEKSILSGFPYIDTAGVKIDKMDSSVSPILAAHSRVRQLTSLSQQESLTQGQLKELEEVSNFIMSDSGKLGEMSQDFEIVRMQNGIYLAASEELDLETLAGEDRYEGRDLLNPEIPENESEPLADTFELQSPFSALSITESVSDEKNNMVTVSQIFDDPYKYLYDKKDIVAGEAPISKEQKKSLWEGKSGTDMLFEGCSPSIVSATYDSVSDKYTVVFMVEVVTPEAALQLVHSKLEMKADALMKEEGIGVVSKLDPSGDISLMIPKSVLTAVDSELIAVDDTILLNRRTGTKAILLTEQNVAYVGNEIVEASKDTLMTVDPNGEVYYNLNIIKSLLSNTYYASIGPKDFYSMGDVQQEEYIDMVSPRGDGLGTAMVGKFKYKGLSGGEDVTNTFINMSQVSSVNNTLIKEFNERTLSGMEVDFRVIVDWKMKLPSYKENLDIPTITPEENPSISEINQFYYTRPADTMKELQDWWDNNLEISNALANVMYGTNKVSYITCGYLVPTVTILFDVDNYNTVGYVPDPTNLMEQGFLIPIIGQWFQKVGSELSADWVSKFIGSQDLYNKIIYHETESRMLELTEASMIHTAAFDSYEKFIASGVIRDSAATDGYVYYATANESSIYFPQKAMTYAWLPMWVHAMFNNDGGRASRPSDAANSALWRDYMADRSFRILWRRERRNDGTLFTDDSGKNVWMVLPTGAAYKAIDTVVENEREFTMVGGAIQAKTREYGKDYYSFVGKTVTLSHTVDGEVKDDYFYVSRMDGQYLELIGLDPIEGYFDNSTDPNFLIGGVPYEQAGYDLLKSYFVGEDSDRVDTVDVFQYTSNALPESGLLSPVDTVTVVSDSSGSLKARIYQTVSENGLVNAVAKDLEIRNLRGAKAYYNPVIRVSVLGWDVDFDTDSNEYRFNYRRTLPGLIYTDLYVPGLTKTVIDTLVAKSTEAIPLNELPAGSVVRFGDMYLYKNEDVSFTTAPIRWLYLSDAPKVLDWAISVPDLRNLVYTTLNFPVDIEGKSYTVSNYIKSVGLGSVVDHEKFKYSNTLVGVGSGVTAHSFSSGDSEPKRIVSLVSASNPISSVVAKLELLDGLLCVPTDRDSKMYTLLFSSIEVPKDNLVNELYLKYALDEFIKEEISFESVVYDFHPLPNQDLLREEFNREDRIMTGKDIVWWVKCLLCTFLGYLMMMCVLMWCVQQQNTVAVLVERVKYPSNGRKGLDLVRFFTAGILDSGYIIPGRKLFVSMMMLCALFALIVIV